MDGDCEDRPEDHNLIYNKSRENPSKVITADRIKRAEGPLFKLLYECHKILTYIFTGKLIKFGNYSCLPKEAVVKLVKEACIWSSFSGSVAKIIINIFFLCSRFFIIGGTGKNLQFIIYIILFKHYDNRAPHCC